MLMSFRFTTGTRNPPPPSECFAALDRCIAPALSFLPKENRGILNADRTYNWRVRA